jgi:galactose mutarotase-like enzyme
VALADGLQTRTIGSAQLQATFVPGAAMLCCSLRHEGEELLAQRDGVRAYAERGATMGIPLLYPWANRLAGPSYPAPDGDSVELPHSTPPLKFDANGLPLHGVLPSCLDWELLDGDVGSETDKDGDTGGGDRADAAADAAAELRARLRWDARELLAIFPFAHTLELHARVAGAELAIETRVHADSAVAVPVAFGFHPYLTIPDSDRRTWEIELPVRERLLLDAQMIPTGTSEPFARRRFVLGDGGWDDPFAGPIEPSIFSVTGAKRWIELQFLHGFSHAQVYSPAGEDFICFEPMTAPANALRSGDGLRSVEPGRVFRAAFRISVSS